MFNSIAIVTIVVQQLAAIEPAYQSHFDYRTVDRGAISDDLAAVWQAPATRERNYLLMQPADGREVYLRFVEGEEVDGYGPMRTFGWNAIELLVKDPDGLAEKLTDSAFEIVGPPKDLWAAPNAPRAMQAIGPGNELLYLTRNDNFATNLDVDRVFIMVLGGPSMAELSRFYTDKMGLKVGDATPFKINVISNALNLPAETTYPLAIATVSDNFLIELDEYPNAATARPVATGSLPPGIAMVSFITHDLDKLDVDWRAAPRAIDALPYNGRRVGVTTGPAGEWIEVIEAAPGKN
jgi:catechol 2,3-dioxygenase-like lactoylglutathione lyase family enzyme